MQNAEERIVWNMSIKPDGNDQFSPVGSGQIGFTLTSRQRWWQTRQDLLGWLGKMMQPPSSILPARLASIIIMEGA